VKPPIDNGRILITGASSGIGREIARVMAARAGSLILVARREDRLRALREQLLAMQPSLTVDILPCDLADPSSINDLIDSVLEDPKPVDILVNNAGVSHRGLYERSRWEQIERMIRVNVIALAMLTHRLVPGMVQRRRGGILNIGSGYGLVFGPGDATYVGTKHYVDGFTESLRSELGATGVVVTQVNPGPVITELHEAGGGDLPSASPRFATISAEQCAREAVAGFDRGRAMVMPGFRFRMLMRLVSLIPRPVYRLLARSPAGQLRKDSPGA
jgi:uncharacterized protein